MDDDDLDLVADLIGVPPQKVRAAVRGVERLAEQRTPDPGEIAQTVWDVARAVSSGGGVPFALVIRSIVALVEVARVLERTPRTPRRNGWANRYGVKARKPASKRPARTGWGK